MKKQQICRKIKSIPEDIALHDNRCWNGHCVLCGEITVYCQEINEYICCEHCDEMVWREKRPRIKRNIKAKIVKSVNGLEKGLTDKILLKESEMYDPENYDPLENIEEKEVIISPFKKINTKELKEKMIEEDPELKPYIEMASDEYINCKIGKNIKKIRELKGMSKIELASKVKKTRQTISAIENGLNKISISLLYKIANALSVDIKELLL